MNSVGIPEGTVIREKETCRCVWHMLLSDPPQYKLVKKCQMCKDKDELQGEAPSSHFSVYEKLREAEKANLKRAKERFAQQTLEELSNRRTI